MTNRLYALDTSKAAERLCWDPRADQQYIQLQQEKGRTFRVRRLWHKRVACLELHGRGSYYYWKRVEIQRSS